jgi:hypothetical protein
MSLRLKRNQGKVFRDPKRFGVCVTGRRWGKTTTFAGKIFHDAWQYRPSSPGGVWGYFAPTYKQAKLIAWDIFKQTIPPNYRSGLPNESDLKITLLNGQTIRLFGMDKSEHLFGIKLLGGVGDEYDQWKPGVFDSVLRPALSDTQGKFWFIGNPDSTKRKLKELYDDIGRRQKEDPKTPWTRYHFKSIDGGYIPPEEIEQARKDLDERTFLEQYEASFLDLLGQVYYGFGDGNICDKDPFGLPVDYNPRLPIRLHWDFNVNPFCVGASHFIDRVDKLKDGQPHPYTDIHVFDEFAIRNSNTVEMAHVILNKYREHRAGIIVYGDAAGKARHTAASKSDYQIIIDIFKNMPGFQVRVREANPAVKDRVNAVNSKLKAYDGKRHAFVHPKNKRLIRDFMNVIWKEGTMDIDKTDLELTHPSDGFGYMCEIEFPVNRSYVK